MRVEKKNMMRWKSREGGERDGSDRWLVASIYIDSGWTQHRPASAPLRS